MLLASTLCLVLNQASGFVIAPPWANPVINPCSETSWQLIFWPSDGRCYRIFEQGPCPDTQELAFHSTNKRVSLIKTGGNSTEMRTLGVRIFQLRTPSLPNFGLMKHYFRMQFFSIKLPTQGPVVSVIPVFF